MSQLLFPLMLVGFALAIALLNELLDRLSTRSRLFRNAPLLRRLDVSTNGDNWMNPNQPNPTTRTPKRRKARKTR